MSRLNKMDYTADFIRGWPNDGALESSTYPIASGVDLEAGDLVVLDGAGALVKTSAVTAFAGIVVRGNLDDKSVEACGKAIVLWSGYIVRTTKIHANLVPDAGAMEAVVANTDGTFIHVNEAGIAGTWDVATVVKMGYVLEKGTTDDGVEFAVIIVK